MSRSSESVTRLDIRFPNEMYRKLQQIAVKDGAKNHHISQKVEISPTVIKLVQFALDTLDGMLSDSSDKVPDKLSDILTSNLPDKISSVSDISDNRIEAIVDKRLAELGLFPVGQTENNSGSHSLPDKADNLPDNLSDTDVIISDKVPSIPDSLSDTKNIPSDDSSDSESIAEDVQIIQTEEIDQVGGEIPESLSFGDFHKMLDLPNTGKPNKAKGDIAIATAKAKGHGDWTMNSTTRKFTKLTEE